MKKILIIIALLVSLKASSQCSNMLFPTIDSLRTYINIYVRNSAVTSFTNLRLNTAMVGITQWLECIESTGGSGGVDTLLEGWAIELTEIGDQITIGTDTSYRKLATQDYLERYRREYVDNISGQFLIWDLTDATTVTLDGSNNISAVADLGSGNNDISIATSGVRPSYSASGGSNNKAYVEVGAGKTFGVSSLSLTTTPATFYVVCQLPNLTDAQRVFEYSPGIGVVIETKRLYVYTGVSPYYSQNNRPAARTQWMVLKVSLKDLDGMGIKSGNEVEVSDDLSSNTALTLDQLLFDICDGIKISEVRGFNRVLTELEDDRLQLYFQEKYQTELPEKWMIAFGDSHTSGTMSGTTVTGGSYITRLQDSTVMKVYNIGYSGSVVNHYAATGSLENSSLRTIKANYAKWKLRDAWLQFQYGTNDAANESSLSINWATWKADYMSYIQQFIDAGFDKAKIIICTPPYSTAAYPAGNLFDAVEKIREIADEMDIHLADFYQEMTDDGLDIDDVVGGDDIHGDAAVHQLMFEVIRGITEDQNLASGGGGTYTFQHSLTESAGTVNLVNDNASPGFYKLYGTNTGGTKGWQTLNFDYNSDVAITSPLTDHGLVYDAVAGKWENTYVIRPDGTALTTGNLTIATGSRTIGNSAATFDPGSGFNFGANRITLSNVLRVNSGTGITTFISWDAGGLIGTETDHALQFFTNSAEKMRLNTNGTLNYAADYSASYTSRSLVDKAYVDGLAGGTLQSVTTAGSTTNVNVTFNGTGASIISTAGTSGIVAAGSSFGGEFSSTAGQPILISNSSTTAGVRPAIHIQRNASYTGAANDGLQIRFDAKNSADANKNYALIDAVLTTATASSEVGAILFKLMDAGAAAATKFTMNGSGLFESVSLKTANPTGGTAGTWKLGSVVTTTGLVLSSTTYIQVDIGGTLYRLAVVDLP